MYNHMYKSVCIHVYLCRVLMLPNTVELDPIGILYLDEVQNSIAVADVRHSLKVDLAVRLLTMVVN